MPVSTTCKRMRALQQNHISGIEVPIDTKPYSRVRIGRVYVDRASLQQVLAELERFLVLRSPRTVFYANSYAITSAETNDALAATFQRADLVFCDGFGVYVASRSLGAPVAERFAWPDWID